LHISSNPIRVDLRSSAAEFILFFVGVYRRSSAANSIFDLIRVYLRLSAVPF
jgi:hypothetical protein